MTGDDWRERGKCREHDPNLFFPETGDAATAAAARAVCAECPVRRECLEYALTFSAAWLPGIWGGLSERERRRLPRTATQPKGPIPRFAGVPVDRSNHDTTEWREWGPSRGWRPSGPQRAAS